MTSNIHSPDGVHLVANSMGNALKSTFTIHKLLPKNAQITTLYTN